MPQDMSSPNPIIPPGSPLQRSAPAKNSKLVIAVSVILAVHVFILSGVLIQGCHRQETAPTADLDFATNLPALTGPESVDRLPNEQAQTPPPAPVLPPPLPDASSRGTGPTGASNPLNAPSTVSDAFEKPAPGTPATRDTAPAAPTRELLSATTIYEVKAGDNLTKIGRAFKTTPQVLRELNGLKTDRILVGQKLKVPAPPSPAQ